MKIGSCLSALIVPALMFSGCVTSHYTDKKNCECTRRYFTPLGISWRSCSDTPKAGAGTVQSQGEELKVASGAPEPSLRQSQPAKTIAQNIKATTQGLGR